MKTCICVTRSNIWSNVYILPLRNENLISQVWYTIQIWSLYPTFKEWKPKEADYFDVIGQFISYL